MTNPQPQKVQVVQVEWLKPGWILSLRQNGCEAMSFDIPHGKSDHFARRVIAKLEQLRQTAGVQGVFLSKEDCAIVTEHFPDNFYKD
jgi:hypothetical protein